MSDRLTDTIDRLQDASTRASGLPVSTGIMFVGPAGTMQYSGLTIPDLLFAAQELRRLKAIDAIDAGGVKAAGLNPADVLGAIRGAVAGVGEKGGEVSITYRRVGELAVADVRIVVEDPSKAVAAGGQV